MDRSICLHKNSAPLPSVGTSGSSRGREGQRRAAKGRVPSSSTGPAFSAGCPPASASETFLVAPAVSRTAYAVESHFEEMRQHLGDAVITTGNSWRDSR